ncbi:leucine-rich repeat-containing protein 71-like [Neodiprion lecontei]|uniref:Leucine-rich repeat-containing protein 71-like n=1 Tax=Neodiprion lecontei TaxID=441921 RepID=A0ABM3FDN7_NEOLC|nr:leucine-rich repeat-containing protein 71-like [Neodiprion lecontei]
MRAQKYAQHSTKSRSITGGKQTFEITLAEPVDETEDAGKVSLELTTVRQKPQMDATVFNLLFDHQVHLDNPVDLRSKDCHVDVFMLEALNNSIKKFSTLTTLKLQRCLIDEFGIAKIAQILAEPGSTIKDLNLDMNSNTKQNHHLLCATGTRLLYLSLKMCEINDDGVAKIASNLSYHDEPCTSTLIVLNLANNTISQIGAEKIGNMLRTNRSLQSLTLTGNKINDAGVKCILDQLSPFTLTHAEIVEKRRRNINRLKLCKEKMDNLSNQTLRTGSTASESKERGRDSRISKKRRGFD